ncbi:hypothetical protein SDC9_211146 [bioreactor metagenome]|uniref:Uncharacterized protein n=1 Tax=bioreactor metagenome TaxID=1076179 RepID=A0A645JI64_9ZZZZ
MPDRERADQGYRDVDQKDPVPGVLVADPAAHDGAQHRRDKRGHGPQADGCGRHARREDAQQQRLGQRHQRAAGQTLQDTRKHQHAQRIGQAAQQR